MTIRLSTGLRDGMLNATGMKEAFTNGVLYLYTGAQPASADNAVSGTLLVIISKDEGAFAFGNASNGLNLAVPSGGVVAKNADNWLGNGITDGTIGWFRLMGNPADALGSSTSLPRLDGSVANSGADLNLGNIIVTAAAPFGVNTFSFTLPAQ